MAKKSAARPRKSKSPKKKIPAKSKAKASKAKAKATKRSKPAVKKKAGKAKKSSAKRGPTRAPTSKKQAASRAPAADKAGASDNSAQLSLLKPPEKAPQKAPRAKGKKRSRVTAEQMSIAQRDISISEFFTKNRHLLGFDNASRALLTSVKEAVDNSLDACEEAGISPTLKIVLEQTAEGRFSMTVEDNGPGIVKNQIPKVFGRLLYGSKFHRLRQSRGQQGIGISAAGMYGQLTTGQPVVVTSRTRKDRPAHHYHIVIDTAANRPMIVHEDAFDWEGKDHGTSVCIQMEATYKGGRRSVDEWVQQVSSANPHVRIEYWPPAKKPIIYPRVTERLPPETQEIKPHPYGVELGLLARMMQGSRSRGVGGFLQSEFSRVSKNIAGEICTTAGVSPDLSLKEVSQDDVEALYNAIGKTKIMSPPTNCLAPIGEAAMLEGLKALLVQQRLAAEEAKARKKSEEAAPAAGDESAAQAVEAKVAEAFEAIGEVAPADDDEKKEKEKEEEEEEGTATESPSDGAEPVLKSGIVEILGKQVFITAVTRSPKVYRGNPFQVEAAVAYGGHLAADDLSTMFRFANRVPLLYQQGACAMTQAVVRTNWKSYRIDQSRGALPSGPLLIMVNIASVWVPFTSEAKEAVAHYDEIIGELKYALQECGRRLSRHIRRGRRIADAEKKQRYIEKYIPHIGFALQDILGLTDPQREKVVTELTGILERSRKM